MPDGTFDDLDVRVALDRLLVAVHGRVSPDVYAQVLRICQLILVATEARERESPHSADIDDYHLHQVAVAYLPGALDAYLAVPGIYAGMSAPGRKSPHENLLEQLNLIEGSVKRLTDGVVADETNRLEAHGRFLAEALGRSKLNLEETGADKAAPTAANMAPNDADAPAQSSAAGAAPHE